MICQDNKTGKIFVIEGTDFSGKTTQYDLLKERFEKEGISFASDSFPNYGTEGCYFVDAYLKGVFCDKPTDINPKLASLFYTMDRYASFKTREWGKKYLEGENILFARYITSNILHQASKYEDSKDKFEFIDWLYEYECGLFGLPKEDCVILLDMPQDVASELKKKRLVEQNGLTSSGGTKDIHEEDMEYLKKSYNTALEVAEYLNWNVVHCVDETGRLKTIEEIHNEIYDIVMTVLKK